MGIARRRPGSHAGKAVVLWEETGRCTTRATGVGGPGTLGKIRRDNVGKGQGLVATCKDRPHEGNQRRTEGKGLAHEPV
jgi:hypothetical protein